MSYRGFMIKDFSVFTTWVASAVAIWTAPGGMMMVNSFIRKRRTEGRCCGKRRAGNEVGAHKVGLWRGSIEAWRPFLVGESGAIVESRL